jgi:Ni,Fe-hydrogenase III large subunit
MTMGATGTTPPAKAPAPLWTVNGAAVRRADVPELAAGTFRALCIEAASAGGRLAALFSPDAEGVREIVAVIADDARGAIGLVRAPVPAGGGYPALSTSLPQAQAFEREIFEEHGIRPEGHPWLKPLRRHADLEPDAAAGPAHPFFRVEGEGVHEVAVGPVHAGIIEPGHFRFQCHGESVLHLEIQLGYQRRGAEALLRTASLPRRMAVAESIAGDTAVGHALACAAAAEALAGAEPPLYAQAVRGIALELERLANHVGDLGALCNDVGYQPGAAEFGRLRGEFLNLLLELSGNRFGRGLVRPGGVRFGLSAAQRRDFADRISAADRDLQDAARTTFDAASVGSRFERTGIVPRDVAEELGLVGPAARASGCDRDVRRDHPSGIFRFAHVPVSRAESGDVMARALVRWLEVRRSLTFVREQVAELPAESLGGSAGDPARDAIAVALVEGWRGEIAHVAATDAAGRIAAWKVVDPSFHNWFGLTMALRGAQISDFPLCNKSFDLSYAGHDL